MFGDGFDMEEEWARTEKTVLRERLEKEVAVVPHPMLRQAMLQTWAEMLQGTGPTFRSLQGGLCCLSTPPSSRTFVAVVVGGMPSA